MSIGPAVDLRFSDRWEIEGILGSGGFGVVYAALDRQRSEHVALKILRNFSPAGLARFKGEFRSLVNLSHPNLVSLYELISESGLWFFTMELIQGVDLVTSLRQRGALLDPASVRSAFRQLAEGLFALHQAKKLHRDIKPSNILVDENERVVVLDFGLVTDMATDSTTQNGLAGTVAYMSPEQCAGDSLSEASDWYSFGIVLYEVLTGRVPFGGAILEVLQEKQRIDPVSPREIVPGTPPDLDRLCMRLLDRQPALRPSTQEILSAFGSILSETPISPHSSSVFVGRDLELRKLYQAFDTVRSGHTTAVYVHGVSGIGKSSLVHHFLEKIKSTGAATIVQGRCYERESVPFKALDSLVDQLTNQLGRLTWHDDAGSIPQTAFALARIFPVLYTVLNDTPARHAIAVEPQELRRQAVTAFHQILDRLAARRPVILFVDDMQWGDVDSITLLTDVLRIQRSLPVLLVVCFRSEDRDTSSCLRILPERSESAFVIEEIAVEALPDGTMEHLSRLLDHESNEAFHNEVVRESHGNPLFLRELIRYGVSGQRISVTFEDALRARMGQLPADSQRVLVAIALAGQPISGLAVARCSGIDQQFQKAVAPLRSGNLIRTVGQHADWFVTFHDRIREAVVASQNPAQLQEYHARLAAALKTTGEAPPETLADHYEAAGNPESAVEFAAVAAERASEALAFDRAVHLYQRALKLQESLDPALDQKVATQSLYKALADALVNVGRGLDAAHAYLKACEGVSRQERLKLQQRAAEQLLHSGHIDRGLEVLKSVLSAVGLPFTAPGRIPVALLLRRFQIRLRGLKWTERPTSEISADELLRIDACSSVATGLALVDIAAGAALQSVNLLLSLRAGESYRVAQALAMEAGYISAKGGRSRERAARLIDSATSIAERTGQPHALGLSLVMSAACAWNDGRWLECSRRAREATRILREKCTGVTWERDTASIFEIDGMRWMGRWAEMKAMLPLLIADAHQRGDLFAETILQMHGGSCAELANDEPDKAQAGLKILRRWSNSRFHLEHLVDTHTQVEIALYCGDGPAALKLVSDRWLALRRSLLLNVQTLRIQMHSLRARAALGAVASGVSSKKALLRSASREAASILRETTPWCIPAGTILQACTAAAEGRMDDAVILFQHAEKSALDADMILHSAVAKRRRAIIQGGETGRVLLAEADAVMSAQAIRNPERLTAVMAP